MRLNFRIKLRRHKFAVQQITFQLGHINSVSGKTAQGFIQRRRNVFQFENKGSDKFAAVVFGNGFIPRHNQKTGCIVGRILNIRRQNLQTVNFCRQFGGNRRLALILPGQNIFAGLCRVNPGHRLNSVRFQKRGTLRQSLRMRRRGPNIFQAGARQPQQLVLYAQKMLADNMQPGFRQQKMNIGHPAGIGVFNRYHRQIGLAGRNLAHSFFKSIAGQIVLFRKTCIAAIFEYAPATP